MTYELLTECQNEEVVEECSWEPFWKEINDKNVEWWLLFGCTYVYEGICLLPEFTGDVH